MDGRSKHETALARTLAELGVTEDELATSQTIARPPTSFDAGQSLPAVAIGDASDLRPLRELGRGGMGVIHLAAQKSLDREVAVKSSLASAGSIRNALVREARITGSLEHPNLVPVHALGADDDGKPLLIMKRIEGVTLGELLDHPEHEAWAPLVSGHGDLLRAKIEILIQVCRALAFAHARGVIHRDLKPENVMIGSFGEVYLLDWGVALRLSERANEPETLVGTPGYMAPEMALCDSSLVDARTDVFLLGATLYEILTGKLPHDAANAVASVMKAIAGEPPSFAGVDAPPELTALVTKAMAKQMADRPPTADAFREELARFLVFRDAEIVARDARTALARTADDEADRSVIHRALIEARFGFMTALRMRPGDPKLEAELRATIERLVAREVDLRSAESARSLLGELQSPPAVLVRRIEALEADIAKERDAAERMAHAEREADASSTVVPLTLAMMFAGIFGAICAGVLAWRAMHGAGTMAAPQALAIDVGCVAVFGVGVALSRKRVFATTASRRVTTAYIVVNVCIVVSDSLNYALGDTTSEAATRTLAVTAMLTAAIAVNLREVWPAVPALALASVGCFFVPALGPFFIALAVVATITVYFRGFSKNVV